MREVSVTDLELAVQDLYKAIRLSSWDFIYDIDGTAEIIANAVAELAEKRQSEVPPHGRLIDADDLLNTAFKLVDEETFRAFRQLVIDATTIIPASEEKT